MNITSYKISPCRGGITTVTMGDVANVIQRVGARQNINGNVETLAVEYLTEVFNLLLATRIVREDWKMGRVVRY